MIDTPDTPAAPAPQDPNPGGQKKTIPAWVYVVAVLLVGGAIAAALTLASGNDSETTATSGASPELILQLQSACFASEPALFYDDEGFCYAVDPTGMTPDQLLPLRVAPTAPSASQSEPASDEETEVTDEPAEAAADPVTETEPETAAPVAEPTAVPVAEPTAVPVPADEMCTDLIKSQPRWACLTDAFIGPNGNIQATFEYGDGGTPFSTGSGFHLHVFGNNVEPIGAGAEGDASNGWGTWKIWDIVPTFDAPPGQVFFNGVVTEKLCVRIATSRHTLESLDSGNCFPIRTS